MFKKIFGLLLLFVTAETYTQNLPCEFSWANAPTTSGNKNFVTAVRSQPYQGPCLAFAFNAAIETMYGIENTKTGSNLFSLSDAYLDYKVWHAPNYLSTLNSGFKIPLRSTNPDINSFAPSSCKVNNPDPNGCSIPRSQVLNYINHPNGQRSFMIYLDVDNSPPVWSVADGGPLGNYATVGNSSQISASQINDDDDIKNKIINDGPIVVKVDGSKVTQFRSYSVPSGLSYHAFTIIGWTDDSRWVIKDSWPSMAGVVNTHQNINLVSLVNSGDVEMYQVSQISYNGGSANTNPAVIDTGNTNCNPPVALQLTNIGVNIDYVYIGGYLYHKFWVNSNVPVDQWVWGIDYPNGARKRSQVNNSTYSSVLLSPFYSGNVTVYVRATKDGQSVTKERNIYLSNGQSGGGGLEMH